MIPPSATSTPAQENAAPPSPATSTPAERAATTEFVSPPSHNEERLNAAHSNMPVRYRTVDNLIGEDALGPGLAQWKLEEASLLLAGPDSIQIESLPLVHINGTQENKVGKT
ncbi:hypothetical protein E2562_018421 [Oryza meyeriana var. granulata]|uniref:Uncharacterized protein n=1 Tax=Oryza meyeriana var. granulata TaxID=110450 RepID=A0A6G1D649_9ORYZ|nr:hypothetical protein E2562_018421 [Oryza meyeriana var. granulata]